MEMSESGQYLIVENIEKSTNLIWISPYKNQNSLIDLLLKLFVYWFAKFGKMLKVMAGIVINYLKLFCLYRSLYE